MTQPFANPMKTTWTILTLVCAVAAHANPLVTLDPSASSIDVGGAVTVNLNIAGLNDFAPPSVGAWLAEISYSDSILGITSADVIFGSGLDLGIWGSVQSADDSTSGVIEADEVSLEDPADLNLDQPAAFTLASFTFTGLAPGVSQLSLADFQLSDADGFDLAFEAQGAAITVRSAASVPDSGGIAFPFLATVGLILLFGRRLPAARGPLGLRRA